MLRKHRNPRSLRKAAIFIFVSSIIILVCLSILFIPRFLFEKPVVISPVVKSANTYNPNIERLLTDANIQYSFVNLASDYYDIELKDSGKVYLSSKKNIGIQISSLTAILKQLTINGKRFNLIDFRFDKPVIVF